MIYLSESLEWESTKGISNSQVSILVKGIIGFHFQLSEPSRRHGPIFQRRVIFVTPWWPGRQEGKGNSVNCSRDTWACVPRAHALNFRGKASTHREDFSEPWQGTRLSWGLQSKGSEADRPGYEPCIPPRTSKCPDFSEPHFPCVKWGYYLLHTGLLWGAKDKINRPETRPKPGM